jgi:hypothetical protein
MNDLAAFSNSDEESGQEQESVVSEAYLLCTHFASVNVASLLLYLVAHNQTDSMFAPHSVTGLGCTLL